ncbi:MAG TPA: hypothetical protein VMV27_02150 [Candidatus Binataceae bacterium]|nr:hypothetical protein [Candidatus Binataceae bacterium]
MKFEIREVEMSDTNGPNWVGIKHYRLIADGREIAECFTREWAERLAQSARFSGATGALDSAIDRLIKASNKLHTLLGDRNADAH